MSEWWQMKAGGVEEAGVEGEGGEREGEGGV